MRLLSSKRGTLQRGQTMLEFVIVFPVVLGMVMMILQLSLDYNARNRVQMAAFAAARAAIVYIPSEVGESANTMRLGGSKYAAIKTAAVLTLMPIAAIPNADVSCDVSIPSNLSAISGIVDSPGKRFQAACHNTSLTFQQFSGSTLVSVPSSGGSLRFLGGDEDVVVTVSYTHEELFPVMAVLNLASGTSSSSTMKVQLQARVALPLEGALVRR